MATKPQLPALDPKSVKMTSGSAYPKEHAWICKDREKARLGEALGLKNFGVNYVRLPAGCGSSHRHWHHKQDEFIYVLDGELTLVTDGGEQILKAGMVAGFPAGKEDGHHLLNRSDKDAFYLEVGDRMPGDGAEYPDLDMRVSVGVSALNFVHKDGTPYED